MKFTRHFSMIVAPRDGQTDRQTRVCVTRLQRALLVFCFVSRSVRLSLMPVQLMDACRSNSSLSPVDVPAVAR